MKGARAEQAGIASRRVVLPAAVGTEELVETITALSHDRDVHDVLLQHPVGPHTPLPGGVGPMTIAVLLAQTVEAATRRLGIC